MKSGLTRAEHNVAASLMRRFYDWRDHTYCNVDMEDRALDADTLEEVDWLELATRKMAVTREEIGCEDGPFTLTPTS